MEVRQHLPRQVRCASPTGYPHRNLLLADGGEDASYFIVEPKAAIVGVANGVSGVL